MYDYVGTSVDEPSEWAACRTDSWRSGAAGCLPPPHGELSYCKRMLFRTVHIFTEMKIRENMSSMNIYPVYLYNFFLYILEDLQLHRQSSTNPMAVLLNIKKFSSVLIPNKTPFLLLSYNTIIIQRYQMPISS